MNKPIRVGQGTAKMLRLIIAVILLVLAGRAFNAGAQTVTNLHSFVGFPTDGSFAAIGLVQGIDGNFYGTTAGGGAHNFGTVFRISSTGTYSNLYSFVGPPTDGYYPIGGIVQGSDGNFYGTTAFGGSSMNCTDGCGSVYRISPNGNYTNLHFFVGPPTDGGNPYAALVQGNDGTFYGMTTEGGTSTNCTDGCGIIFRIGPGGSYTNLRSFVGPPTDGRNPYSGLVQGSDGKLYGTTTFGGSNNLGTVFRLSSTGSYTTLFSFSSFAPNTGYDPGPLVQGSDGNLYGTTYWGGMNNEGTVFRISPSGSYTNLYFFPGFSNDGINPRAGLVQGSDGNFYGTATGGGANVRGTAFRISPSGSYTSLYSFASFPHDGNNPQAGLVQGNDGNFYGTTAYGGTSTNCTAGCGTVFKLTVSLNPPANQITGIRLSGTNIVFNILSVAGETYQLQFSSSMTPTNWVNVPGVSVTNCIGALLTVTNFGGAVGPQGFYRFDVTP